MHEDILSTVGSPLVRVASPEGATVAAKVESFNPGGSAKDRPAVEMIRAAEAAGDLGPGDRLVEATSGNTGIGLAMAAAALDYDLTVVMPASKSPERRRVMAAYGADVELVDGDVDDARDRAAEIAADGAVALGQFENPANPRAHYRTTGPEILESVGDRTVDALVAGVGTGGTITGVGRRLREEFPEMTVVAVEPERNAVLSTGEAGDDDYQGMGPGFVSDNLDRELIDRVETVTVEAAERECRRLAREEGILVGQSSGASSLAARRVAADLAAPELECPPAPTAPVDPGPDRDGDAGSGVDAGTDADSDSGSPSSAVDDRGSVPGHVGTDGGAPDYDDCPLVVTVFWDGGERYLSTGLFDDPGD